MLLIQVRPAAMLKHIRLLPGLIALAANAATAVENSYELLQPALDESGMPLTRPYEGDAYPVTRLADDSLRPSLARLFEAGFPRAMLALDQRARDIAGVPGSDCMGLADRTLIYLSPEDGGYAREGFWFSEGEAEPRFCKLHYIDVTADADAIDDGSLEELLAHEMAHVWLRRLVGDLPAGASRTFHSAFAVTDYVTAFDEGFAIAMQPLSEQYSRTGQLAAQAWGAAAPDAADLWFSRIDRRARKDGVRRNDFIHRPVANGPGRDGVAAFDPRSLKSGQEMLASEGLVGTVIYRLLTSHALPAQSCQELPGLPAPASCRLDRLFETLHEMRHEVSAERSPLVLLLEHYARRYSGERAAVYRLFAETTFGATVDQRLRQTALLAMQSGADGDLERFVPALRHLRLGLATAADKVIQGSSPLDAAAGPQLWLAVPAKLLREAPWSGKPALPLTVNLNTALADEFMAAGLGAESASALLASRDEDGAFRSLADAIERAKLEARDAELLRDAEKAFAALPPYRRR